MPQKRVGIVIPTINLWNSYTKPCLDSIFVALSKAREKDIDGKVFLIDNGSTDETFIEASKIDRNDFHYQRNLDRWGFQKTVNWGCNNFFKEGYIESKYITIAQVEHQAYDYVLVVNNDILLHPDAICRLIECAEKTKNEVNVSSDGSKSIVGMVTCMDVRGECQTPGQLFEIDSTAKEGVAMAPHPNFSAFMVSRETWNLIGEFDEGFFPAYFEDNDYHYRMKLLNKDAVVYPPALFYHYGSRTQNEPDSTPIVTSPMFEKNKEYFVKKWGGVPGQETFRNPFADPSKSVSYTQQEPLLVTENPMDENQNEETAVGTESAPETVTETPEAVETDTPTQTEGSEVGA